MTPLSFLLLSLFLLNNTVLARYEPTWESIDSRPLPSWYDEAKFGIFMHWGVFSVPSYGDEWFWWYWKGAKVQQYVDFMEKNYRPGFTYADFAAEFTAEFYDPNQWADLLKASGAKYVVLTTKHHEGFDNWPSNYSFNWNSMDVGPKRDLVGDLARAIRSRTDIHFGVYHSMFEWFNPLYLADKATGFKTKKFVNGKTIPELYELVNNYQPEVIWSDGSGSAPYTYWGSTEFLAWLYNDSPVKDTVVVNDRWGANMSCKHGGYYTCHDRYNPGKVINHKWENCMTIDRKSWGYRREAVLADYLTMDDLTQVLAETISCGGNLLMNVGPTHDGRIVPIFEERLRQMGQWLAVNGEAIYKSQPWQHQNDTFTKGVWYTSQQSTDGIFVYAIALDWPTGGVLQLGSVTPQTDTKVTLLGYSGGPLKWATSGTTISIRFPDKDKVNSDWAWVVRFEGL